MSRIGDGEVTRGGDQVIPRPPGAQLGGPPPWNHLDHDARQVTLAQVREAMATAPAPRRTPLEGTGVRASAVLAVLFDDADGLATVVLTRRAQHLRSHRGEVSFPGGGEEPHDADLWATALRESHEEVGLEPAAVHLLGGLDHLRTVTGRSYVVPFVGCVDEPPRLEPDPGEVERILLVPLAELLAEGVYREEYWGLPGMERPIMFFEIEGDTVWGATASMLRNLLELVLGLPPLWDG
jgi:8-oxo-dGTP pyrophosphatase MutT (NUDIX family)